ncbi:MAG: hypothetical protein AAGK97_16155, partial [Bacteroidota bacterium]
MEDGENILDFEREEIETVSNVIPIKKVEEVYVDHKAKEGEEGGPEVPVKNILTDEVLVEQEEIIPHRDIKEMQKAARTAKFDRNPISLGF